MYSYSNVQWLFFFYFYCFAGWCVESANVSIRTRKLTNRGFMRGPFLPLYGSGGLMMLVVSAPFQGNLPLVYVAGCIGATLLEYVTGVTMEALFKVRYWDYSKSRFQFQGHICLRTSLSWGLLTILMTELIHVPVERFVLSLPGAVLNWVTYVLTAVIFSDFALSFKAAIDLRDVLERMEQVKGEMVRIQKRLDKAISLASQGVGACKAALTGGVAIAREEWMDGMAMRIEDIKSGIERRMDQVKSMVSARSTEQGEDAEPGEDAREALQELKTSYAINLADRNRLGRLKDFFQRDLIRSNPDMTSESFGEALEEVKRRTMEQEK